MKIFRQAKIKSIFNAFDLKIVLYYSLIKYGAEKMFYYKIKRRPPSSDRLFQHECLLVKLCEILNGSYHLRSIRILIVIPGNNLYLIQIIGYFGYHGLSSIEKRAVSHADYVG